MINFAQAISIWGFVLILGGVGAIGAPPETTPNMSPTWQAFLKAREADRPPFLPDYSYAGYALADGPGVAEDHAVYDVTQFGAVPDDEQSDRVAVKAAISAAEENGGGVVRFPKGRFLLGEIEGQNSGIVIESDNIVLRGAGSGPGGTELYMRHNQVPKDPSKKWSTPKLITFTLSSEKNHRPVLAKIVGSTQRETFSIEVDDISRLNVGDYVILNMQNPEATPDLLAGLNPWDIWTVAIEKGTQVAGEKHRVVKIEGRRVTFAEPIHIDINPAHGWNVTACPLGRGWGVEDITFRGEAPTPFVHHKDPAHDSGWSILGFNRGLKPYVRRCRFISVSHAVSFGACYGATAINCSIEGRQGHGSISSDYFSYGTLMAFCLDVAEGGAFHGYGANHGSVGTVIYRCKNSDRGLDWHASGPYATLVDATSGGLIGNGGHYAQLPNHLQFLTLWNFKQTAGTTFDRLDWWQPRKGNENYSMAKIVRPMIVGFHGQPSTFLESSCDLIESHGKPVQPESLYEAQLELRLGSLPDWIGEGQRQYDYFLKHGYFDSQTFESVRAGANR